MKRLPLRLGLICLCFVPANSLAQPPERGEKMITASPIDLQVSNATRQSLPRLPDTLICENQQIGHRVEIALLS